MRTILKVIIWIISLIIVFIVSNLVIASIQYKGITNYIQILNNQSRGETAKKITIFHPASVFFLFYPDGYLGLGTGYTNDTIQSDSQPVFSGENLDESKSVTGAIDPYDPQFEDEFNSFFGGDDTDDILSTGDENLDLDSDISGGWLVDDQVDDEETHLVGEELIKKFNE